MSATEGLRPSLATVEVLAQVALAQVERLEQLGSNDIDPQDPAWWDGLAREADDLATSARAVAISIRIRDCAR